MLTWLMAALLWPTDTAAPDGPRATKVEFFQGPVIASGRVIGLGGAYIGVAEGSEGMLVNPASLVVRSAQSLDNWSDWDWTLAWLNVETGDDVDLDQSGLEGRVQETRYSRVGVDGRLGRHGLGLQLAVLSHELSLEDASGVHAVSFDQMFGGLGYGYAWGELALGGVLIVSSADVNLAGDSVASLQGAGFLAGALWMPTDQPWRLGATLRSPVLGTLSEGSKEVAGAVTPDAITVPWEFGLGASLELGARPHNPKPTYGVGPKTPPLPRQHLMVSADLILTGPSMAAVGARSFLEEVPAPVGRDWSLGARLGGELEAIEDRMVVRAGTYYEPSRYETFAGRVHATAGLDVRAWKRWRLGPVVDVADAYFNWGLGLGLWH